MELFDRTNADPAPKSAASEGRNPWTARPTISLLHLVRERRFSWRNKRHRRKLLEDNSLIEFVARNEDAPVLWRSLVEIQLRYRHDHGCLDMSYTAQGARSFESHLRRVGEDGERLERPLLML